jgi:hypothetical protein
MSSDIDLSWLDSLELTGTAASFAKFCKEELQRRSNADIDFDPEVYTEAVKLVLRKLGGLEMEGMQ